MRYNREDLLSLASQSSDNYDKEGLLILNEKSEGFFRRREGSSRRSNSKLKRDSLSCVGPNTGGVSSERWFRLNGNLLFYLKTDELWSEPSGLIILENYSIIPTITNGNCGMFSFVIQFEGGGYQCLGARSEDEKNAWMEALTQASFNYIRTKLRSLRHEVDSLLGRGGSPSDEGTPIDEPIVIKAQGYTKDVSETPLEVAFSADNLLCDSHGRPPNPRLLIHVRNSTCQPWIKYACTEVIVRNSNPVFLTSVMFRESDGLTDSSEIRIRVMNVRERLSGTQTLIGQLSLLLSSITSLVKVRLPIDVTNGHGGFLTLCVSQIHREKPRSTESTPSRIQNNYIQTNNESFAHRRTKSLPVRLGRRLGVPTQAHFNHLLSNPFLASFRFHSGLGGDIHVHEIMAEIKLAFKIPIQLLSLWIGEEKELVEELVGLGELREPWHTAQVNLLQKHFSLMALYTQSRNNLIQYKGADFRLSSNKFDSSHEFVPLNLHLQRLWAQNESLHLNGFNDVFTSGAFTAIPHGLNNGGLSRLLENYSSYDRKHSKAHTSAFYVPNKVNMTQESVQGIKRLRKEIVERMQLIFKLAKEKRRDGLEKFVEEIFIRCRLLLSICDQSLIEEAFAFLEEQKLSLPTSKSLDFNTHAASVGPGALPNANSPLRSLVALLRKGKEENLSPDSGLGLEESLLKSVLDSPSANYYRPTEEPEPWDLTQLNIEASIISLSTKIRGFGAKSENRSEIVLGNPNTSTTTDLSLKIPSCDNTNTSCHKLDSLDWTEELSGSLRKLRLAMDGLLKTSRLAHSVFRLQELPTKTEIGFKIKHRRDVCFSQALTSVLSALMVKLWCRKGDEAFMSGRGPLVTFHSLLTAHGAEEAMLEDMKVAVDDLRSVEFLLCAESSSLDGVPLPKLSGSRGNLKVSLPVPPSLLPVLPRSFTVSPVLFNVGINEVASLAQRFKNMELQDRINKDSYHLLLHYYAQYKSHSNNNTRNDAEANVVGRLLERLRLEIESPKKKNIDILSLSARITRNLRGLRFVSCKSGKDRTAMGVTLEEIELLSTEYDLSEDEIPLALDAIRSEGTRRENTLKNIGVRKYAFNSFQVFALPPKYRPPPGTFGATAT